MTVRRFFKNPTSRFASEWLSRNPKTSRVRHTIDSSAIPEKEISLRDAFIASGISYGVVPLVDIVAKKQA